MHYIFDFLKNFPENSIIGTVEYFFVSLVFVGIIVIGVEVIDRWARVKI